MGLTLVSTGGSFHFSNRAWLYVLRLAGSYGWQASGTKTLSFPDDVREDWGDHYIFDAVQPVTAADAAGIADAIELALADPDHDVLDQKLVPVPDPGDDTTLAIKLEVNPYGWSRSETRAMLEKLVLFCRAGEFKIW